MCRYLVSISCSLWNLEALEPYLSSVTLLVAGYEDLACFLMFLFIIIVVIEPWVLFYLFKGWSLVSFHTENLLKKGFEFC